MKNVRKILCVCLSLALLLALAAGVAAQVTKLPDGTELTILTPEKSDMTVDVKRPAGSQSAIIAIPLAKKPSVSTVAMQVLADGSRKILLPSTATETELRVKVPGDCKLVLVDNAKPLADVDGGSWYFDSVQFTASRELLGGVTPTHFAPEMFMTRQMLWTVLARLNGETPADYEQAKTWAVGAGLSDGTNPGGNVTREQLVTTLYRYAQTQDKGLTGDYMINMGQYKDLGQVSSWASEAFVWAKINAVADGTSATTLSPKDGATRAQVAKMICGLVNVLN